MPIDRKGRVAVLVSGIKLFSKLLQQMQNCTLSPSGFDVVSDEL